ncbi:MAG: cytidylate kinase family protein [Treponema sp.]|nr:cytidylate kinase family protein [Treponema sp.]
MKEKLMIAISGKSGCGNTTVSKMVADSLGLRFINFTFRSLAEERDMDLIAILDLASKNDSIDREVDTRQIQLARESGGCVLGSRLAIWMLEEADIKIYLNASLKTRAGRIVKREGGDPDDVGVFTANRDRRDQERYLRIYNIDTNDYKFANLVIDTDNLTPRQITDMIIGEVNKIRG